MKQPTYDDLGGILFAMRTRRGLTIDDLQVNCSNSTISRFETGQSSPSVTKMTAMFNGVMATMDEPFSIIEQQNSFNEVWRALQKSVNTNNTKYIKHELNENKLPDNHLGQLLKTLFQTYCQYLDVPNLQPNFPEMNLIFDYLLESGQWFELEYQLFATSIYFATPNQLELLVGRAIQEYNQTRSANVEQALLFGIFNAAVHLIETGERHNSEQLLVHLQQLVTGSGNLLIKHRITLVTLALDCKLYPRKLAQYQAQIQTMLTYLELIGATELMKADKEWLAELKITL